jgi:hypothetical protein
MRAWTVDADDIRVAEDFDESLLHRTPEIDSFLSLDRDDKFIVIGTKGFGKTLLLKAKRILYQRKTRAVCLPTSNLLDKPIGDKIFNKEVLAFFAGSSLPWSKVWLTAIATATLKHLHQTDGVKVNPRLTRLIAAAALHSVIDHFVRLLDFSPSELLRTANDTDGHLVPRLRAVSTPVAIFIDGVDEYFNKHNETVRNRASVAGEQSPDIWHFAQLGLVEVAYQLRRINHHLKVFAAVRKEAYARLQTTVMGQQYRGSAVDIAYPVESLREIFVNTSRRARNLTCGSGSTGWSSGEERGATTLLSAILDWQWPCSPCLTRGTSRRTKRTTSPACPRVRLGASRDAVVPVSRPSWAYEGDGLQHRRGDPVSEAVEGDDVSRVEVMEVARLGSGAPAGTRDAPSAPDSACSASRRLRRG